jgi:cytochrome c peroxidase
MSNVTFQFNTIRMLCFIALFTLVSACGSSGDKSSTSTQIVIDEEDAENITSTTNDNTNTNTNTNELNTESVDELPQQANATDEALVILIEDLNLDVSPVGQRNLPNITSGMAQLGKKLFFSKSLGGAFDTACASCHHPMLGGGDNLSLPIGVDAINPTVLGIGRQNSEGEPLVPRNSPTIFNVGLWDASLFWDSRVESIGKERFQNGAASGISTPDSGFNVVDNNAGANLVAAQAKFPVTSVEEMKSTAFEIGSNNQQIREHLAARIGDFGVGLSELSLNNWLVEFQIAFNSTNSAQSLITFENIAQAIAEYQRSMVFVDSPWQAYMAGDLSAITEQQKQGALLFFQAPPEGGAGCNACHNGPTLSDGNHHTIAFPQIGLGKGHGDTGDEDFGRGAINGNNADQYSFRTPSLLNISVTAPYSHAGAYQSLEQVVRHYNNPRLSIENYIDEQQWCQLPQFSGDTNCINLYQNVEENSQNALTKLDSEQRNRTSRLPQINLNNTEVTQLVDFLTSLTDPCVESRVCLSQWIATETDDNPDNNVLIATDENGVAL